MSVHKDKATGKWYYTGKYRDLTGERHDYKKRGFRTQKEAKEAEQAFLLKIRGGQGRIKMNALIELYHEEMSSVIKKTTLDQYKTMEKLHIKPYFADRYIDSINTTDVNRWIKEVALNSNEKPLSDGSVKNVFNHLKGLFKFAFKHRFITNNPCNYTKPYKDPNKIKEPKKSEDNYWEIDEFNKFIETINNANYKTLYYTLFLTGLRIGELQALRWNSIDLDNYKLTVNSTTSRHNKEITSPKTKNSYRTIDMPSRLVKMLQDRYEFCRKIDGFDNSYFIFGDVRPISYTTVCSHFKSDIDKAGVKNITIHGLRHSHASYLLSNAKISEALVAERLGHTIEMLRKTYAHIYEKRRNELTDFIKDL